MAQRQIGAERVAGPEHELSGEEGMTAEQKEIVVDADAIGLQQLPYDAGKALFGDRAWRAIFLGGGPMLATMESWASRHGDKVRIVTAVSHEQVPEYLNAFDVLCSPSRTTENWREVFGRMVIEAFACEVAVLSSDCGELPNVIADAGMIVSEDDINGWVRSLEKLLDSRELREDLANRGLDRVKQHFTWSAAARRHLEFFETLLDQPLS